MDLDRLYRMLASDKASDGLAAAWKLGRIAPTGVGGAIDVLTKAEKPTPWMFHAVGKGSRGAPEPERRRAAEAVISAYQRRGMGLGFPRTEALGALSRIGHPVSIPTLAENLKAGILASVQWAWRGCALVGLARTGAGAALPYLVDALNGKVRGLGSNEPQETGSWRWLALHTGANLPLRRDGTVHVPTLAAWGLGITGLAEAVLPLLQSLQGRYPYEEPFGEVAVQALVALLGDGAARHLVPMLESKTPASQRAAALELVRRCPSGYEAALVRVSTSGRDVGSLAAGLILARGGNPCGAATAVETLKRSNTGAALILAGYAAGELGLVEAWGSLVKLTGVLEKRSEVREAAAYSLADMLRRAPGDALHSARQRLRLTGKDLLEQIRLLTTYGGEAALDAAPVLMQLGGAELEAVLWADAEGRKLSGPKFLAWLTDDGLDHRPSAMWALDAARLGDPSYWIGRLDDQKATVYTIQRALPPLLRSCGAQHEPEFLRIAGASPSTGAGGGGLRARRIGALRVLASCGTPAAFSPLTSLLEDPSVTLRAAAGMALAEIGIRHPHEAQNADLGTRLLPIWDLGSYRLRAGLGRFFAAVGYTRIAPYMANAMRMAYGVGPFASYRAILARCLGGLPHPETVEALQVAAMVDPSAAVRQEAQTALITTGHPPASETPAVREAAQRQCDADFSGGFVYDLDEKQARDFLGGWEVCTGLSDQIHVLARSLPHCCAHCRGASEVFWKLSYTDTPMISNAIEYEMEISLCHQCTFDALPPAEVRLRGATSWQTALSPGNWVRFANSSMQRFAADAAWPATHFPSCALTLEEGV